MTDTALDREEPALGYFEDDPVWGAKLRVKGLGDGLSKLADVEPVALRRGSRGVLHVEYWVDHVAFPPGESEGGQPGVDRLQTLRAGRVVIEPGNPSSIMRPLFDELQRKLDEAASRRALFDSAGEPTEPVGDDAEPDVDAAVPINGRRRRNRGQ